MLTEFEKQVIAAIQGDIPVTERPYQVLAEELEVSEDRLLSTLQALAARGVIRRFGATLRHQQSGITANAMVAWQVTEAAVEKTGQMFAENDAVTHCYRRDPMPDWPYNLYTMVHAGDRDTCLELTRKMAEAAGITEYTVLFSQQELKKTSMQYFDDEED